MKRLAIILIAIISSCSEMYVVPEVQYRIPAGEHASVIINGSFGDKLRSLKQDSFEFIARFDKSARYALGNENQDDINKLMGFSEANQNHQQNSIRFGWRYLEANDKVEILAYFYKNGQFGYERIAEVEIDQSVVYRIILSASNYYLEVDGIGLEIDRDVEQEKGLYYLLYPYFGGNEKAPHDIDIYIKEIIL